VETSFATLTIPQAARIITFLAMLFTVCPVAKAQTTATEQEARLKDVLVLLMELGKAAVSESLEAGSEGEGFFPEQIEEDENGKLRRLHQYFGEYRWSRDPLVASLPDDVMFYWYHQLSRFTYDHHKIRVDDATWQTVPYTWRHQRGVCRDSATVLADMLVYQQYDARLVVGYWPVEPGFRPEPGDGHAWVVIRDPGTGYEYLLESTEETWHYARRFPPRTFQYPQYLPVMQVTPHEYLTRSSAAHTAAYTDGWTITPAQ
jgi:hypothetical protein